MLVEVDTRAVENVLRKRLVKQQPDKTFFTIFPCGHRITCGMLLDELERGTPLAKEMVEALTIASIRLWILRGGVTEN